MLQTDQAIDRDNVTADEAQVAIFDATNSTEERREKLVSSSGSLQTDSPKGDK